MRPRSQRSRRPASRRVSATVSTSCPSLPTDCDQTKGLNAAQDILTANPDVTAIYGACGPPIIGAIEAIRRAGKTIKTVGFDAGPDEVKAIVAGDERPRSPSSRPRWVSSAPRPRSTRSTARRSTPNIDTGTAIVTKDNAADFR